MKLFLLVLGLSVVEYSYNSTFAQLQTGCTLTGQYYTWEYQTWEYLTGQELTWGTLINCVTLSWYFTGGVLDESGSLTWETRVEESQTGCELTWQTLTEWYLTGSYLTWGYRTGWYLTGCTEEQTGNNQTWNNQTWNITSWNGICESGDVVWSTPISWSIVRNIFPITWTYSWTDCLSGLSLQLRDHNSQRIHLSTLASWTTSYTFDSRRLYSFQLSWLYNIIGNTGAGNFTLYSGTYSGTYSRLFSWYKLRLITSNQTTIQETLLFTIDNQVPTLSWVILTSPLSWVVAVSGAVTLRFTASEELSWIQVTLWSGKIANSATVSWLDYIYVRNITSLYPEWNLVANISFADKAWNTGVVLYTSSIVFDNTKPTLTWFIFNDSPEWMLLHFSWSESVRYTLHYQKALWAIIYATGANYLTAQQVAFSWVELNQWYIFTLSAFDNAGNNTTVTGDFIRISLWNVVSHVYIVPITTESILTGNLSTLAVVLKAEVEKFNVCKGTLSYTPIELQVRGTTFNLEMPLFKKSQVKTLVNAFTLYVLDKIKHNYSISSDELTEITKKFDSFLVVLKLLRDDDNICKQNLSNYHISQFKSVLLEYNLDGLE